MDISERIINIRESKKIKQFEIANYLGIDQPNYSRLEKRGDKLTIEQLKQIAGALRVELNELLGIEVQTVDKPHEGKRLLLFDDDVLFHTIPGNNIVPAGAHTKYRQLPCVRLSRQDSVCSLKFQTGEYACCLFVQILWERVVWNKLDLADDFLLRGLDIKPLPD